MRCEMGGMVTAHHNLVGSARVSTVIQDAQLQRDACSTRGQDLRAQRSALKHLGVVPERIYTDKGRTGRNRDRRGLREALAACRAGDTIVVTKLDRLGRSAVDLHTIARELEQKRTRISIGGPIDDPPTPPASCSTRCSP